ncbi:MAG TPA: hypothetical protein PLZ93_08300 [Nocardioides sp.]|uniref:hypothetical protein n=1 Tax=uncultured Nocardioides sp. TaxID=198441 RepID=UPI000EDBECFA|nr:hypothetical protein [uncultured Nocardioides sp.]HCB04360.1 hypothetical protein [Nocardioides sp.]HRD60807.1 hypothetical protein [Nocardioides sp.]HRI95600.1 hypothetical protein [Nocardioides sp.]HRK44794.1 hypothetical protein [Nocardioides sp.]
MSYELSAVLPFVVIVALLALVGSIASVTVLGQSVVRHHQLRVARHQSIPTYYRRLVLAH